MLFVTGIPFTTTVCGLLTHKSAFTTPTRGRPASIAACSRRRDSWPGRLATKPVDASRPARSVWNVQGVGAALPVAGALRHWNVPGSAPPRQHWVMRARAHWLLALGSGDVTCRRCAGKGPGGFACGPGIPRTREGAV